MVMQPNFMTALRLRWPVTLEPSRILGGVTITAALAYSVTLATTGVSNQTIAMVAFVGLAALLSSIAGFAFSAICGAMVFHFRSDTVTIVQIMLVCSISNQAMSVWTLRHDIRPAALVRFVVGGGIGVPIGIWLLLHLPPATYTFGLGVILVAYGSYMLVRPPIVVQRQYPFGDVVAGLIAGLAGGFAATPGAPVSIWCATKGWTKTQQRAVFQPVILILQILALTLIAATHARSNSLAAIPPEAWLCVPAGLAGTWWGLACYRKLSDRQFGIAINMLLIASGAGLAL